MKERTNHMEYMEGMEVIDSTLLDEVISAMDAYDYDKYTDKDVENALSHDVLTTEDFAALLSPAALNHLEEMAQRAQIETRKHFGNSISMFTPLYIANYCENYWNTVFKYPHSASIIFNQQIADVSGIIGTIINHCKQNSLNLQFRIDLSLYFSNSFNQLFQTFYRQIRCLYRN